ncbi:uncharacterized protein UV8b_02913 [Ustilaginoidea virens]|uniref:DNL-type domain-containing protein n=1 Tax=Ustilaginoidea virens TaxID=1159556 RepID=A0A063BWW9_USTVR|nr:uncharacterized protein UV8b_02913 [Ustilaginoidea virens]QUC18672.1 hypothetical protein UV8b_02913 [Ustilaginoidea virens]GAO18127.1 hypothetical protein UVI_02019950 [Ustilaginoidea virens]
MAARPTRLLTRLVRQPPRGPHPRTTSFLAPPFVTPKIRPASLRAAHSIPRPPRRTTPEAQPGAPGDAPTSEGRPPPPNPAYYQLSFTCLPCGHRSHHNVSKQGYHTGSTLITCPGCRNRHVISDHLNIFGDRKITVEDLMREKGRLVKRGSLGEDGDIEFWPEEEQSARQGGSGNNAVSDREDHAR